MILATTVINSHNWKYENKFWHYHENADTLSHDIHSFKQTYDYFNINMIIFSTSVSHFRTSKLSNVRQKWEEFLIQKIYFALEVTWPKYCNWPLVYWFSRVPWSTSGCFLRYNSLKDSEPEWYIIIWGEDDEDQRGFS